MVYLTIVSISDYIASSGRLVNIESERIKKEAAMV
jgi:hypothetical protein